MKLFTVPLSFRTGCRAAEAKALTNLQLTAAIDVWIDDIGDDRVASGDRVVCQEQHGLTGRRDLERSSEHSLAYEFASVRSLQGLPLQPEADTIAVGRDGVSLAEQGYPSVVAKPGTTWAGRHAYEYVPRR